MFYPVVLLLAAGWGGSAPPPLAVVEVRLSQSDGGEPLPSGFAQVPGATFFLRFRIEGYKASSEAKISLHSTVDAVDPQGIRLCEPITKEISATLAPQDKEWKPTVSEEIVIPPLAPSGTYHLKIAVTDDLAKTSASKDVSFEVRGHDVEPSPTLTVRNFHFYRDENSTEPLAKPAYRPGDAVWARFDITGYKFAAGNRMDVSYGIAVLGPAGKVLWSNPEAAVEQSESFYPKHYLPGGGSIQLQPNIRPGDYAIVVTAHDKIGSQDYEAKEPFAIE